MLNNIHERGSAKLCRSLVDLPAEAGLDVRAELVAYYRYNSKRQKKPNQKESIGAM